MADIRGPARATRGAGPVEARITDPESTVVVDEAPAAPAVEQPTDRPAPAPAQRSGGGGFFPLLLGGVAAGLIGFAVAWFGILERDTGGPDPVSNATRIADVEARIGDLSGEIEALTAEVAQAVAAGSAVPDEVSDQLAAIGDEISGLGDRLGEVETALSEAPPAGEGAVAPDFQEAFDSRMADFEAEVARVTSAAEAEVERARAEAEATRAEAEKIERQAMLRAAVGRIATALDTGAPFEETLSGIDALDVPEPLAAAAADGVLPLAELQRTFPDAARAALAASARGPDDAADPVDRFRAFLLTQTNARSLEPREGDSADAVLSRAEAALRGGDLGAALAELDALSPEAAAAMADWRASADARRGAVTALEALSQDIDAM